MKNAWISPLSRRAQVSTRQVVNGCRGLDSDALSTSFIRHARFPQSFQVEGGIIGRQFPDIRYRSKRHLKSFASTALHTQFLARSRHTIRHHDIRINRQAASTEDSTVPHPKDQSVPPRFRYHSNPRDSSAHECRLGNTRARHKGGSATVETSFHATHVWKGRAR